MTIFMIVKTEKPFQTLLILPLFSQVLDQSERRDNSLSNETSFLYQKLMFVKVT